MSSRGGLPVEPGQVFGVRAGGVTRQRTFTDLDREILQFLLRFTYARGHHVAGWTGASGYTVQERLAFLSSLGMVDRFQQSLELVDENRMVRRTVATVWEVTAKGAAAAGAWVVPGTGDLITTLPAPRSSRLMANHIVGVADLAVWYRRFGFDVAAEREILSLERPSRLTPDREVYSFWSVPVPGRVGIHPPDLGAVAHDQTMWAVELERATKSVSDYTEVIGAYQQAGMGQVWHVLSNATATRIAKACQRLGIRATPTPAGANVSEDGLFRLQGWLPGRMGLSGPATWKKQWPGSAPAGLSVPREKPDLSSSWRRGGVVNSNAIRPTEGTGW